MKGTRYGTEKIISILREVDGGKSVQEVCKEHNITAVTYCRWKKRYGQIDINEAKRLRELERENGDLKKMLAEQLLKVRVLEVALEKKL